MNVHPLLQIVAKHDIIPHYPKLLKTQFLHECIHASQQLKALIHGKCIEMTAITKDYTNRGMRRAIREP
jgi:hypothetical protein